MFIPKKFSGIFFLEGKRCSENNLVSRVFRVYFSGSLGTGFRGVARLSTGLQCGLFPKEIHYGDLVFATIKLTNHGEETVIVPKTLCVKHWLERDYFECGFFLCQPERELAFPKQSNLQENVFASQQWIRSFRPEDRFLQNPNRWCVWESPYSMNFADRWAAHADGVWSVSACSLEPRQSVEIGLVPIWVPRPELESVPAMQRLKQEVESGIKEYKWGAKIVLHHRLRYPLGDPPLIRGRANYLPLKGSEPYELRKKGYRCPTSFLLADEGMLTIHPRPKEEYALLHQWFLEIPETVDQSSWHYGGVFVHPLHASRSPLKVTPNLQGEEPQEFREFRPSTYERHQEFLKYLGKMKRDTPSEIKRFESTRNNFKPQFEVYKISEYRHLRREEYGVFFASMKARTPEAEQRIARTKELEVELLKRAEDDHATISPTMKEFIILRGFLVDLRYAENREAQQATFDKLLDWVATTQTPRLWTKYLKWIVLNDDSPTDVLPPEDFDNYREKLDNRRSCKLAFTYFSPS